MQSQLSVYLKNLVIEINSTLQNRIIAFFIILIVGSIIAKIISVSTKKYAMNLVKKTKTKVDDFILARIEKPFFYVLVLIVLEIALMPLGVKNIFLEKARNSLIITLLTYLAVVLFDLTMDLWARKFAEKTRSNLDEAVLPLFHKFSRVFFVVISLIFILDVWGVKTAPLLASLGIAGIAIAFALQSTLGNIFGGVSMVLDKSVKVGDVIKLEDGISGTVLDIGLRSTKIKTADNDVIIFPNGKIAESRIQNLVLPDPSERVVVSFGVKYGTDSDKVKKVVLNAIKDLDTLKNKERPPQVLFMEMGDASLRFNAVLWVKSYTDASSAKEKATSLIYKALNKAKISIPQAGVIQIPRAR